MSIIISGNGSIQTVAGANSIFIDSSSRVSLNDNNKPHFRAYCTLGTPYSPGSGNPIVFNNTWTNVGNCYNTTTGIFTASIQGLYIFNYHLLTNSGTDAGDVRIWLNGATSNIASYGGSGVTGYKTTDVHFTIRLEVGNTIQLRNNDTSGWWADSSYHCWATGSFIG